MPPVNKSANEAYFLDIGRRVMIELTSSHPSRPTDLL